MYNHGQISCFLKIAELGSFTKAAAALHLTTTAVSKQLRNLEQTLNEQLLLRTTRQVILTEFGLRFYERCKLIDEQIDNLNQFIENQKAEAQGELHVLISTITAKDIVLNHLAEFMALYPLIELNLEFSEEDEDLSRQDLDIFVGFPVIPPFTEFLKYRKIITAANILCASKSFIARKGLPLKAEDLPLFPIISHSLRKPAHFLPLADGGRLYCGKPILYMNNFSALNQACLAGIGLFLTGDLLVNHWLKSGELVQVLPEYRFKHYEIYIFYRPYAYELLKIRCFVDFFSQKFSQASK